MMPLNEKIELVLDTIPELQDTLEELRSNSLRFNMLKNRLNGKEFTNLAPSQAQV